MKTLLVCALLGVLIGIIPPLLPAQQSQYTQKPNPEIEALKQRVAELEKQLQTVQNVEKMELATNYTDAQTKLLNADFEKFERELRDSNSKWLREWSYWFLGVIGVFVAIFIGVGAVFWFWLGSRANGLIADRVEKSLTGFREAVGQVDILKNQLSILEKERAVSMLESIVHSYFSDENPYPEEIKALREEVLVKIFCGQIYNLGVRHKAAEVLAARKSRLLVSPLLKFLNSVVDSDINMNLGMSLNLPDFIKILADIRTPEAYQGLKEFLNRLLREHPKHKDLFLIPTVLSLAWVSIELNVRDSVAKLKRAMSHFQDPGFEDLSVLVGYFDKFNDSAGIKEILTKHITSGMPEVERKCLELLEKHDSEFVEEWRARKAAAGSEA